MATVRVARAGAAAAGPLTRARASAGEAGRRARLGALLLGLLVTVAACASQPPPPVGDPIVPPPAQGTPLWAVGDLCRADFDVPGCAATEAIVPAGEAVAALGDIQYETGTLADFQTYWGSVWGGHDAVAYPVIGNHEYLTPAAAGYYDYWNGVGVQTAAPPGGAGTRGEGWWSTTIGSWTVVAANSDCQEEGSCSAQQAFVTAALDAAPGCSALLMHRPPITAGYLPITQEPIDLFQVAYDHGADIVVAAHEHSYQRFDPLGRDLTPEVGGLPVVIVGTGGKNLLSLRPPNQRPAGVVTTSSDWYGVVRLDLRAAEVNVLYIPQAGGTYTDEATLPCR